MGLWPVGIAFIVINAMLRNGTLDWLPRRRSRPAPTVQAPRPGQPAYTGAKPDAKAETKRSASGEEAKITAMAIIGTVLLAGGAIATVSGLSDMVFYGGWEYWHLYLEDVVGAFVVLMAGGGLCYGARTLRTGRRMRKKIDNIVGDADHMYIKDIAAAIPCTQEKCIRHLENCIDKGVFGEDAYLDMRTRCLVVRGEPPKPEPKPRRKKKEEPAAEKPPVRTPARPSWATASAMPWANRCPNPSRGTVAPAPAKSTSGPYSPNADSATPAVTYPTSTRAGVMAVRSMSSWPTTHRPPPTTKAQK